MFKIKGIVSFVGFPKNGAISENGFYMFSVKDVNVIEGDFFELQFTRYNTLNIRGYMSRCEVGQTVELKIAFHSSDSYGAKYEIQEEVMSFDIDSEEELEAFLYSLNLTERQRDSLSEIDNLVDVIKNGDIKTLTTAKGVGESTALKILEKFEKSKDLLKYYEELYLYGFENLQHRVRIVKHYMENIETKYKIKNGDEEEVPREYIDKEMRKVLINIKNNPYILTNITGFGLATVDEIALTYLKIPHNSKYRITSFITHMLNELGNNGKSYIEFNEFFKQLRETVEVVKKNKIKESIQIDRELYIASMQELINNGKLLYHKLEDGTEIIALKYFFDLEKSVAEHILRISSSPNDNYDIEDVDEKIKDIEKRQGYSFAEKQKDGIQMMVNNMFSILSGAAGTGKSSTLNGTTSLYEGYKIGLFAFSGKASQRMTETTGLPAQTMHMHIMKHEMSEDDAVYDIYIIDEASMIHLELIRDFLQTIPIGKKVIILGDIAQLQALTTGNLLADLIRSGKVPVTMLTEIFRQGLNSGILYTSMLVRQQQQLTGSYEEVDKIIGINKDFELITRRETTDFHRLIIDKFNRDLEAVDNNILDVQILAPISKNGEHCVNALNNLIQTAFSHRLSKDYLEFGDTKYHIGDKVINIKNNYKAKTEEEDTTAVFNGNIGVVVGFIRNNNEHITGIIIDFPACGRIVYTKADCTNLSLAYAITVHKSQGSEAKRVIYVLTNASYSMLTTEGVYTAITRAKSYCTVIAQCYALTTAIATREAKNKTTFLSKMLGGEL